MPCSSATSVTSSGIERLGSCRHHVPSVPRLPATGLRILVFAEASLSGGVDSVGGMIQAEDILTQLDKSATDFAFPDLGHGYFFAVDARMHLFRGPERWALIVETVGYNPRMENLIDVVHVFGNCLTTGGPGFVDEDFLDRVENMGEIDDEESYAGDAPVVVRGRPLTVDARTGEPLENVFRRLVPEHRELLLADEAELRSRIPGDLPKALQLEEWHQPEAPAETLPSMSETYRQIAEVLASGDVSRYRPSLSPNTHWSNWPNFGQL